MPVIIRSQTRARSPVANVAFFRASVLGGSQLPQQTSSEGGFNCSDRSFGGHPSTLALMNERPPAVCTFRADYLTCPALTRENQFVSNTTGRKCFSIYIKAGDVHSNFQKYIYRLTCTHCGIQYVGEKLKH